MGNDQKGPHHIPSDADISEVVRQNPTAERDGYLIPEEDEHGYQIKEQPFGTKRRLRIIIMGAAASTVNFLKKAEEQMQNLEIQVYEKNHDVGGTWYVSVDQTHLDGVLTRFSKGWRTDIPVS